MVTYELIEERDGLLIYAYYAEGKRDDKGLISYDPVSGKLDVLQRTKYEQNAIWYAGHCFKGIEAGEKSGMAAWY